MPSDAMFEWPKRAASIGGVPVAALVTGDRVAATESAEVCCVNGAAPIRLELSDES